MRFLDALLPRRSEQRMTVEQYVQALQAAGYSGSSVQTTYGSTPSEPIADHFASYVANGFRGCSIVAAVELIRFSVFSEARFMWQRLAAGRPAGLFGDASLAILETPWPGGTTGDLLSWMLLDADLAGNSYTARLGGQLVRLRPDWTDILLAKRMAPVGTGGAEVQVGWTRAGFAYYEGGKGGRASTDAALFLPDEVAHFAPTPDPLAVYRGMSWLTPVVREIQGDVAATKHKLKFFENGATPNMVVKLPKELTPEQYEVFVDKMEAKSKGTSNAYRTLYLAGGADATVVGVDMKNVDFKAVQGAGETRIANAGGVPAVLAGLSEGLQGSSLNAGNYGSAKRRFADGTMRPLWRNACGSLQAIVPPPAGTRLWWDGRDVAFLRDDEKDLAEIQGRRAQTIRQLVDAGYDPASVVAAVEAEDFTLLKHSGLYSVQLQKPGQPSAPAA